MALDEAKIKAQDALKELTPEQINAITDLSKNDENEAIGRKTGEIWGSIDNDVKEVLGMEKPQGMKTYNFLKDTVFPKLKTASETEQKLQDATTKVKDLEKKIADGDTSGAVKQQLKDAQDRATQLENQLTTEKQKWEDDLKKEREANVSLKVYNEFDKSLAGLEFKDETVIPKTVRDQMIEVKKQQILQQYKPDWEKVGDKKILVFRDEEGNIARNPNNAQHPFTADELLRVELKDLLRDSQKKGGTGGKGNPREKKDPPAGLPDISSARNKNEADMKIREYLMANGVERGSAEWSDKFTAARKDLGVNDLKD